MRFSTIYDYNYHQRVQVIECACAVCADTCARVFRKCAHFVAAYALAHTFACTSVSVLELSVSVSWFLWAHLSVLPTSLHAFMCVWCTVCVCVCAQSLNLLHLCLLKYIYMKRQLTFLSCLKPWRCDILLTVAGDILPHFPLYDCITPLLSPLIPPSNHSPASSPPTPLSFFLFSPLPPPQYIPSPPRLNVSRGGGRDERKGKKISMSATFWERDTSRKRRDIQRETGNREWQLRGGRSVVGLGRVLKLFCLPWSAPSQAGNHIWLPVMAVLPWSPRYMEDFNNSSC